jgi:hypothetical protein
MVGVELPGLPEPPVQPETMAQPVRRAQTDLMVDTEHLARLVPRARMVQPVLRARTERMVVMGHLALRVLRELRANRATANVSGNSPSQAS